MRIGGLPCGAVQHPVLGRRAQGVEHDCTPDLAARVIDLVLQQEREDGARRSIHTCESLLGRGAEGGRVRADRPVRCGDRVARDEVPVARILDRRPAAQSRAHRGDLGQVGTDARGLDVVGAHGPTGLALQRVRREARILRGHDPTR